MLFDQPVLLYGAGREARSTRAFLARVSPQTKVFVTVDSGASDIEDAELLPPAELDAAIAEKRFGTIIKSPGVSLYKPVFEAAKAAGIAVTSNLNLWGQSFRTGRTVIAITGTKGKSTTATLTHLMLTHSGVDAGLAGNVGVPPLDIADSHQTVIFELSSYQTADMDFLPDIAGLTNLSPEHVDWHGSVENYYTDKLHLIARPGPLRIGLGRTAEDNLVVQRATGGPARLLPPISDDVEAVLRDAARGSRLKGEHNFDNARLAARLAFAAGASLDGIVAGIKAFAPLPHRLEEHRFGPVLFVDDSISTTPEATKAALAAYKGYRIALIAGGHERQQDYDDLAHLLAGHGVTLLVCLPATGARIAAAARHHAPHIEVIAAESLLAAMQALKAHKTGFDAVLLSPGAPSYGQLEKPGVVFSNFEQRGRAFIAIAEELFGAQP